MEQEQILEACRQDAVRWTAELVRRNSENPPGDESAAAAYCAARLREMGLTVDVDEYAPGRVNVTAFLGDRDDVAVWFNGHTDVVRAEGDWTHPPFSGDNDGTWIWGRGAADMKSGCACMMAAAQSLLRTETPLRRGIALSLTADEELMGTGIRRLLRRYAPRADAAVIGEPTQLQVCYGNRGYLSYYIRTRGVACHACEPANGVNAIDKMGHVLGKLERFAEMLRARRNDQLGCVTFSVGLIRGGTCLNTVPALCEIEAECRGFPGMTAESLRQELAACLGDEVEIEPRSNLLASLVPADCGLVRTAAACVEAVTGRPAAPTAFPACTEAGFFTEHCGIPAILLGPGSIARAHRVDERVAIEEVRGAVDVYRALMLRYAAAGDGAEV